MPFLFSSFFSFPQHILPVGVIAIFTVYLSRKKQRMLCCIGAAALLLGGFLLLKGELSGLAASSLLDHELNLKDAGTNPARVEFLSRLGWKTGTEPVEVREVVIPLEFDQVYQNYNAIQREQGFDLSRYAGRRMMLYAYEVLNHPYSQENVRANLLIYQERLVGGDVCSLELDGFMHGLHMPQQDPFPA